MKLNSIAAKAVLSLLMVTLFSYAAHTQAITKAASIPYTNGVPTHTPSSVGSEIAINTVNKDFYFWNGTAWVKIVFGTGGSIAYTDVANTFTQNQTFTLPTLTGSSATNGLNITQTWNTTGSPKLIFANVTPTALGASNSLIDLQVAGVSKFRVSAGTSTTTNPSSFIVDPNGWVQVQARAGSTSGSMFDIGSPIISTITIGTQAGLSVSYPVIFPNAGNANFRPIQVLYTINAQGAQTGTATGIFLNATETALNGMTHNLIDLQVGGTSRFRVSNIGAITNSATSIVSTPAQQFTGTWHTGSGTTNTKPHILIEPASATSTAWNTAGTGLGINAASGFTGNLLDLQLNGANRFSIGFSGVANFQSTIQQSTSSDYRWNNRSRIFSDLDGGIRFNNSSNTDFERLQFGGTTSSFPALQTASSNAQSALAATFTNGSADIGTATNAYAVNQVVQFTTTGTLPTGFATGTNYFIVGTPTSTVIQVSGTQGGSAITAGSAGSGTHTVSRQTLAVFTNGSSTVTTSAVHGLRVGDVIRFSNSGGSLPSSISTVQDYYILTVPSTTTFTFSSFFNGSTITPPETAVTATFSGTPNITTATQNYIAGSVVRFTTTGTLPTGLSTGTDYYVIATALSTTNIQVSATLGGSAIAYTGTGSGTHSVVRQILGNGVHFVTRSPGLYVRTADNSATAALYAGNIVGNAPTGFLGNILDMRVGTTAVFNVSQAGNVATNGSVLSGGNIRAGAANGVGWSGSSSDMVNTFNGGIRFTNSAAADFYQLQFGNGTTSPSLVTFTPVSATATFTAASATIGASPALALRAGDLVQFSNSGGALPAEITAGTIYYILSSGLTATTIQVSPSLGGTAITFAGVGTGTHTVSRITGISLRNSPNTALVPHESLYQRFGAESPEGVVTAPVGAFYSRTDGGAGTSFYVKESGVGNTGWIAK